MTEKMLNIQDQYKFPMGQLIFEKEPASSVTFRMHNRRKDMRIADYVTAHELQEHYNSLRTIQFTDEELSVLGAQKDKQYSSSYLGYLASFRLPEIEVYHDQASNDLTAETTASWNEASMWEIPMLSQLSELWYPRYLSDHNLTQADVWNEGDRQLSQFIGMLNAHPTMLFAEFGTRRRYSSKWQDHVIERFMEECPHNIIGTSNPWLAHKYNLPASGTSAHELNMVYAALEEDRGGNPLDGSHKVITDWLERFPSMPVVLTDTYTTAVTLHDMSREELSQTMTYRIDSGDEKKIGAHIITALESAHIDPRNKNLLFSNSLSKDKALAILEHFEGNNRANVRFGIGGYAANNMGDMVPGWNIVAKAASVNGRGTVKLSDDVGKHIGAPEDIARYKQLVKERLKSHPTHPAPGLLYPNDHKDRLGGFWHEGPNYTADAVLFRVIADETYVPLVLRPDGSWAIPGGFIDDNECGVTGAIRETQEETNLMITEENAQLLYKGVVKDPRATRYAWPETEAYFWRVDEQAGNLEAQNEIRSVQWCHLKDIKDMRLYGSHRDLIEQAVRQYGTYEEKEAFLTPEYQNS